MDINERAGACTCCGEIVYDDVCLNCRDCGGLNMRSRLERHDPDGDGPAETDDWSGGFAENH